MRLTGTSVKSYGILQKKGDGIVPNRNFHNKSQRYWWEGSDPCPRCNGFKDEDYSAGQYAKIVKEAESDSGGVYFYYVGRSLWHYATLKGGWDASI